MIDKNLFLWALPVFCLVFVVAQLRYDRVAISPWRIIEKTEDKGRFWLFIVADSLLVLVLIGQAISANNQ